MRPVYFKQNALLLAAVQSTLGVPAAVTSGNIIFSNSLDVKIEPTSVDQKAALPYRSADRSKFVNEKATVTVEAELAHGGAGGTVNPAMFPNLEPLLRACALRRAAAAAYETGTAQGGNRSVIVLESGASAVDGFYNGRSVSVRILSGASQAPGGADLNVVRLAANVAENAGAAGPASTSTTVILAATASDEDGYYVGRLLRIGSESLAVTAYDGTTRAATVAGGYSAATAGQAYQVLFPDDALAGYVLQYVHYTGTVVDTAGKPSTTSQLFFPAAVVGAQNLTGMYVEVTTGANNPETVRISGYHVATQRATLQTRLDVEPTHTSTFRVLEKAVIERYDAATVTVTLATNLRRASAAGRPYQLFETRLVVAYDGGSKRATPDRPFSRSIGATDYTLGPYFKYQALKDAKTEVAATLHFNLDGQLTRLLDAKGTFTLEANKGAALVGKFTLTGLLVSVTDAAMPGNLSSDRFVPSLPVNAANTAALSVLGLTDAVCHKFVADVGNTVLYRNAPGAEQVLITGRQSKLSVTLDRRPIADIDLREKLRDNALEPVWFAIGDIGRQVVLFFEAAQLKSYTTSDQDGIVTDDLEMMVVETRGGDTGFVLVFN